MEIGSTWSTSQNQFKLDSNVVASCMKSDCCFTVDVLLTGVVPEIIQPRTVSCKIGFHVWYVCQTVSVICSNTDQLIVASTDDALLLLTISLDARELSLTAWPYVVSCNVWWRLSRCLQVWFNFYVQIPCVVEVTNWWIYHNESAGVIPYIINTGGS